MIEQIEESGVIAIIRGDFAPERLPHIAEALLRGGVRVVEVTLNTTDAERGIETLREVTHGEMIVGAGTVRTVGDVDRAVDCGAQFLVSPNLDLPSVRRSQERDVLHLPGVLTPTEAQTAFAAGCRVLKLFPAEVGGPSYLKAIRAPLNDIKFVPTGGIGSNNAGDYIRAGAAAVGVGGTLVSGPDQDSDELAQRAARLAEAVRQAQREGNGA